MITHRTLRVVGLLALGFSGTASAVVWPQLFGPCAGTLQACINSVAPGATVEIGPDDGPFGTPDSYTGIDENITIDKSLTLEARPGIDAVFASSREIDVFVLGSGTANVTLRRLTIRDGRVLFRHGSGVGTYTAEHLRLVTQFGFSFTTRCDIDFENFGSTANFRAYDNTLEFLEGANRTCGIGAHGEVGEWTVDIRRNRIREHNGSLGRGIVVEGIGAGPVEILANQVSGYGFLSGIYVEEGAGTDAHSLAVEDNFVIGQASGSGQENGISITPSHANIYLSNNTVMRGFNGVRVYPGANGATDSTTGRVANNLIAFNTERGLSIGPATIANRNNLVFGNGFNAFTFGPGTLTVDPQLQGTHNPRLTPASPARNAGNTVDVNVTVPPFDADGEARLVGAVDIGAFELNSDDSVVHRSTPTDTSGNNSLVTGIAGLTNTDKLLVTPHHDVLHGAELANTLGMFTPGSSSWAVFHEDFLQQMSVDRRFSVMAPADGRPVFLHTTAPGNINDRFTRVNDPVLDGMPNAKAFITHNWNPGGVGGVYHDKRIGLSYDAIGGLWYIENQDGTLMQSGRSFNVAVAPAGSRNAFTVNATSTTSAVRLEHALLDDNDCAAIQVTRNLTPPSPSFSNVAFSVNYVSGAAGAAGHWSILAEGSGSPTFAAGTGFNVMVQGAQAKTCGEDLSIVKTDGVASVDSGGTVSYTIVVTNGNPTKPSSGTVRDTFFAPLTACSWTCAGLGGNTCSAGGSGNINDAVMFVAGGSVTYTATCTVARSVLESIGNRATVVGANDPNVANDSSFDGAAISRQADLSITKTNGTVGIVPGSAVVYSIVASNAGPDFSAATVTDTFPPSLADCSWTCATAGGASCGGSGTGNLADAAVVLPSGGQVTYTATCTVRSDATGSVTNTATIAASGTGVSPLTEPNLDNNTASDTDALTAPGDDIFQDGFE